MLGLLSSALFGPKPDTTSPADPTPVFDHHGALDIPEIVRHIIVFVLSDDSQPQLLHSSSLFAGTENIVERQHPAPLSSLPWLLWPLKPLFQPQSLPTSQSNRSNDSSSIRLVSRLWYASWLSVRLAQHTWEIDVDGFDANVALDAIQAMTGRQGIIIESRRRAESIGTGNDYYYALAAATLASQLSKRRLQEIMLKQRQLEEKLQRSNDLLQQQCLQIVDCIAKILTVVDENSRQSHKYDQQPEQQHGTIVTEHNHGGRITTAAVPVVRELSMMSLPQHTDTTLHLILKYPTFQDLTLLEISFAKVTKFDVRSLFELDEAENNRAIPLFPGLQHLLLHCIQPDSIPPELLQSSPASRCLRTLVLEEVAAPLPVLRDLVRLFRSPTLRRVHISQPTEGRSRQGEAADAQSPSSITSLHDILDDLLHIQYHHHQQSSSSSQPHLLSPSYASLGLRLRYSLEPKKRPAHIRDLWRPGYTFSHYVPRDQLTEDRLANFLESEQCTNLRELYMPSTVYDVKPFINSFSSHVMLADSYSAAVEDQQDLLNPSLRTAAHTTAMSLSPMYKHVQNRWQCRNLQRLTLGFPSSSNFRLADAQSSRELFGFLSFNCPQIEELDLQTECLVLTWESGLCLTSRWRNLRHLVLRGCSLRLPPRGRSSGPSKRQKLAWVSMRNESMDLEWVLTHPTKMHVQDRRTSRAMCREVLCLPPFSWQYHGAENNDNVGTELARTGYGSHKPLGDDRHAYEPGSLAIALESILELQLPGNNQSLQSLSNTTERSASSSSDSSNNDSSGDEGEDEDENEDEDESEDEDEGEDEDELDPWEGALWMSLKSMWFAKENYGSDESSSVSKWKDFKQSLDDLLPEVEIGVTLGIDVSEVL